MLLSKPLSHFAGVHTTESLMPFSVSYRLFYERRWWSRGYSFCNRDILNRENPAIFVTNLQHCTTKISYGMKGDFSFSFLRQSKIVCVA